MTNNDVLRRLRYALDLSNPTTLQIFRLADHDIKQPELLAFLKKEGEEGYLELSGALLEAFLDGLIALRRGKREDGTAVPRTGKIGNNDILKKLRVALELKEGDLLEFFKLAGFPISKSELGALFRTKGHANYKECGDQLLRNFLKGLTLKYRDQAAQS